MLKLLPEDEIKFINLMRLATKAGKLKFGQVVLEKLCSSRKLKLVVVAEDLSANSLSKAFYLMNQNEIPHLRYGTKKFWGEIFQRRDIGMISVIDEGFARSLQKFFSN